MGSQPRTTLPFRPVAAPTLLLVMLACSGGSKGNEGGASGRLELAVQGTPRAGTTVEIVLRNGTAKSYRYHVQAGCFDLTFLDATARKVKLLVRPHCDIATEKEVAAGASAVLYRGTFDECLTPGVGLEGCRESKPFAPGRYTVTGRFRSAADQTETTATATFEVRTS